MEGSGADSFVLEVTLFEYNVSTILLPIVDYQYNIYHLLMSGHDQSYQTRGYATTS